MTPFGAASSDPTDAAPEGRPVRIWLYVLAALVAAMVLVGGMTRLTDSGLSITEWRPVTGAVPPWSDGAWQTEFAKYQATLQYRTINNGMSLDDFKSIYWWEWGHRFLGRLIGVAFALPFLWFLAHRSLPRHLVPSLAIVFLLGALQGGIGWWMVASGLVERTSVAPYRLAVHLSLAFVIFAALLWAAKSLAGGARQVVPGRLAAGAWLVLVLSLLQVALGALVAGLDAGRSFTTWPLIDGGIAPAWSSLFVMQPAWVNFFENPLTAQFDHRLGAYLLLAVAAWHAFDARRVGGRAARSAAMVLGILMVQAAVGIVTLVNGAPLGLAALHQLIALGLIAHAALHVRGLAWVRVAVPRRADALTKPAGSRAA